MKQAVFTFLQFIAFLIIFALGSFLPPFNVRQILSSTQYGSRVFVWDGLLLAGILFGVILVIEALRKRLASAALWTSLALVLAIALGLYLRFGFITYSR